MLEEVKVGRSISQEERREKRIERIGEREGEIEGVMRRLNNAEPKSPIGRGSTSRGGNRFPIASGRWWYCPLSRFYRADAA